MRNDVRRGLVAVAVAGMLVAGCGKVVESGVDALLLITNSWAVEGQAGRAFNLVSQDDGGASGTFTGEEDDNGVVTSLTGSWSAGAITFTLDDANGTTYRGTFATDNPTTLSVSTSGESIRLVRGG